MIENTNENINNKFSFKKCVDEASRACKVHESMMRNAMLATLSAASQMVIQCKRPESENTIPVNLYLLTIAGSGVGKTRAEEYATKSLKDFFRGIKNIDAAKHDEFAHNFEIWDKKHKALIGRLRKITASGEEDPDLEDLIKSSRQKKPKTPRKARIIHTNATPLALLQAFQRDWPGLALISSEAAGIFSDLGVKSLSIYDSIWDGGTADWETKDDKIQLENIQLTIGLAVQNNPFFDAVKRKNGLARYIGFLARCLFSYPPESYEYFDRRKGESPDAQRATEQYHSRINEILVAAKNFVDGQNSEKITIELSKDAFHQYYEYQNSIKNSKSINGDYYPIQDHAAKIMDNVLRISSLLAHYEGEQEISKTVLNTAIEWADDYMQSARKILARTNPDLDLKAQSRKLHQYLRRKTNLSNRFIDKNEARNGAPYGVRTAATFNAALELLIEQELVKVFSDRGRAMIELVNEGAVGLPPDGLFVRENEDFTMRNNPYI